MIKANSLGVSKKLSHKNIWQKKGRPNMVWVAKKINFLLSIFLGKVEPKKLSLLFEVSKKLVGVFG